MRKNSYTKIDEELWVDNELGIVEELKLSDDEDAFKFYTVIEFDTYDDKDLVIHTREVNGEYRNQCTLVLHENKARQIYKFLKKHYG